MFKEDSSLFKLTAKLKKFSKSIIVQRLKKNIQREKENKMYTKPLSKKLQEMFWCTGVGMGVGGFRGSQITATVFIFCTAAHTLSPLFMASKIWP